MTEPAGAKSSGWQVLLVFFGVVLLAGAACLQIVISSYNSTSTVTKAGDVTRTVTGPSAPPAALVTTCLAAGALLILAGAFFTRITKLVITGLGELDVDSQADIAKKAVQRLGTNADPDAVGKTVARATENLALAQASAAVSRVGRRRTLGVGRSPGDDPISTAVDSAARELGY